MKTDLIAIDPSFRGMGVYIQSDVRPQADGVRIKSRDRNHFCKLSCETGPQDFGHSVKAAEELMSIVTQLLFSVPTPKMAIMETPPPASLYSMGLGVLDGRLYDLLVEETKLVYFIPPNGINSLLGKKKIPKSEISAYANGALGIKPKLNHDEASAYILAKIVEEREAKLRDKPKIWLKLPDTSPILF